MASVVALIPARSGSKRIENKNIRPLAGHPLLAWTIKAAVDSGIFHNIVVSTDSQEYIDIAMRYGAIQYIQRPADLADDNSPDFYWVQQSLDVLISEDAFAILRPTSPFRTADTIRRAWAEFQQEPTSFDSLRAVERTRQHPNKMWVRNGGSIMPYNLGQIHIDGKPHPSHSVPTQLLPEVLVQNASLEIAWTKTLNTKTISGPRVKPFFTEGYEGYDINNEDDWLLAEALLTAGKVTLPKLKGESVPEPKKKVVHARHK